jgi:hypothetical protein
LIEFLDSKSFSLQLAYFATFLFEMCSGNPSKNGSCSSIADFFCLDLLPPSSSFEG